MTGLTPTAVSESPIEPRVFILNRKADAMEVVCSQEFARMEALAAFCPDTVKLRGAAETALASDLGGGVQHSFFTQRRTTCPSDFFRFSEVFPTRGWHDYTLPASASIILRKTLKNVWPNIGERVRPAKIFETSTYTEQLPLSAAGHQQLKNDVKSWKSWREMTNQSFQNFVVEETRSQSDIDLERDVQQRLKKTYKAIRTAEKKKEKEQMEQNARVAAAQGGVLGVMLRVNLEKVVEQDEEDFAGTEEEESIQESPIDLELRMAFESHSANGRINFEDLRSAMVQVFNHNVSIDLIVSLLGQVAGVAGGALRSEGEGADDLSAKSIRSFGASALSDAIEKELPSSNSSIDSLGSTVGGKGAAGGLRSTVLSTGDVLSQSELRLTMHQFRQLYYCIQEVYSNAEASSALTVDGLPVPAVPSSSSSLHGYISADSARRRSNQEDYDAVAGPEMAVLGSAHCVGVMRRSRADAAQRTYWQTNEGSVHAQNIAISPPPLDFREIDWDADVGDAESNQSSVLQFGGAIDSLDSSPAHNITLNNLLKTGDFKQFPSLENVSSYFTEGVNDSLAAGSAARAVQKKRVLKTS